MIDGTIRRDLAAFAWWDRHARAHGWVWEGPSAAFALIARAWRAVVGWRCWDTLHCRTPRRKQCLDTLALLVCVRCAVQQLASVGQWRARLHVTVRRVARSRQANLLMSVLEGTRPVLAAMFVCLFVSYMLEPGTQLVRTRARARGSRFDTMKTRHATRCTATKCPAVTSQERYTGMTRSPCLP